MLSPYGLNYEKDYDYYEKNPEPKIVEEKTTDPKTGLVTITKKEVPVNLDGKCMSNLTQNSTKGAVAVAVISCFDPVLFHHSSTRGSSETFYRNSRVQGEPPNAGDCCKGWREGIGAQK